MGDQRHKKSPSKEPQDAVTDELRSAIKERLARNEESNTKHKRKKGSPGFLPQRPQDIADELDVDPRQITLLLGEPTRPGSKPVRPTKRSALVPKIRALLDLDPLIEARVPLNRREVLRLAEISEDRYQELIAKLIREGYLPAIAK